jgi:hypothetical protein
MKINTDLNKSTTRYRCIATSKDPRVTKKIQQVFYMFSEQQAKVAMLRYMLDNKHTPSEYDITIANGG